MGGYTPTGPWTSGNPPGIDAGFLGNVEAWIQQCEGDSGAISINGSTSGTATCYQTMQGTYKRAIIVCNNFRNGGGSVQNITLPVAFTTVAEIRAWDAATFQLLHSGSAITFIFMTSISGGGFGVSTASSFSVLDVLAHTNGVSPFETISFTGSQSSASTGMIFIEGV